MQSYCRNILHLIFHRNYTVVNVHGQFRAWFIWGLLINVSPLAIVFLAVVATNINSFFSKVVFLLLSSLACSAGIAWYVIGLFWRFSKFGRFASVGVENTLELTINKVVDVPSQKELMQAESGRFIFIFYTISWFAMAAGFIFSLFYLCSTT